MAILIKNIIDLIIAYNTSLAKSQINRDITDWLLYIDCKSVEWFSEGLHMWDNNCPDQDRTAPIHFTDSYQPFDFLSPFRGFNHEPVGYRVHPGDKFQFVQRILDGFEHNGPFLPDTAQKISETLLIKLPRSFYDYLPPISTIMPRPDGYYISANAASGKVHAKNKLRSFFEF